MKEEKTVNWRKFPQLRTSEDFTCYFEGRAYHHTNYFHYTSLSTINSILTSNELWLGCLSTFNDTKEREAVEDARNYYALCFSVGANENLPLWYLYSGIDGRGARIGIAPKIIRKLLKEATFVLKEKLSKKEVLDLALEEGKTLKFQDVIYWKDAKNGKVDLRYSTLMNYGNVSKKDFDDFRCKYQGFSKGLIWYYEKEARLLVKLPDEAVELINKEENKAKEYVVALKFSEKIRKSFKICLAPNIDRKELLTMKDCEKIIEFIIDSSRVDDSIYKGTIDFDFCRNCKKEYKKN